MEKNKTLEQRVVALEQANKPKFKSFFDNNMDGVAATKKTEGLERLVDLLERRVKLLEDQMKRMRTER